MVIDYPKKIHLFYNFERPIHCGVSLHCIFLQQTTALFTLTQTSWTYTDFRERCSHHPDGGCTLYIISRREMKKEKGERK